MKNKIIALIIFSILISFTVGAVLYRPDIHQATIEELQEINGIGEYYATEIHSYLKLNPTCTIEDLDDIRYIGEGIISKLKERYRWLK